MINERMERGAHAQTHHRAAKEARKSADIRARGKGIALTHDAIQAPQRDAHGDDGAEEVRPDVDGLVVQVEEGAQGVRVRAADGPVARADEGVVAAPGGQVVPQVEEGVLGFLLEGLDSVDDGVRRGGRG